MLPGTGQDGSPGETLKQVGDQDDQEDETAEEGYDSEEEDVSDWDDRYVDTLNSQFSLFENYETEMEKLLKESTQTARESCEELLLAR